MKPRHIRSSQARLIALALSPVILAPYTFAANRTWVAVPTDANWSTGTNWGTAVASTDALFFGTSATTVLNNDLAAAFILNGITFNSGASAYSISGNSVTLGGNITNNESATAQVLNTALIMSAARTIDVVGQTASLTAGGPVSGGFALTKGGTGSLKLNSATGSSYTGGTTVTGALVLDFANLATPTNLLPTTGTTTLNGASLGVLGKAAGVNATAQTLGTIVLGGSSGNSISVNANGGVGTTLTLGNTWTRNGGSTLAIDTSLGGSITSAPAVANGIVVGSGGTAAITMKDAGGTGFAALSGGNVVRYTLGTPLADVDDATINYAYLANGSTFSFTGSRLANTLAVDTTSNSGTLDLGGAANVLTLTARGILFTGANNFTVQNGQLGAAAVETVVGTVGTGITTISATIGSGSASLTKGGSGILHVSGASTFTGATSAAAGTLRIGASTNQGVSGPLGTGVGNLQVSSGATVDLNGFNLRVAGLPASGGGIGPFGQVVNNSGSGTANLSIGNNNSNVGTNVLVRDNTAGAGTVSVTKDGNAQIQINNANTFSGGLTLNDGSLRIQNFQSLGTGTVTFAGNSTTANNGGVTRIFQPSNGFLNGTIPNNIIVNPGITGALWNGFNGSNEFWGGSITGSGICQIRSDGFSTTTTLTGNLSGFTGTYEIMAGNNAANTHTVNIQHVAGSPLAPITMKAIATTNTGNVALQWNGIANQSVPFGDLNTTGSEPTLPATITLRNATVGTTTFEVGALNASSTFKGVIASNGTSVAAVKKVGSGVWTLSGNNTYTGSTTVDSGTLNVTGSLSSSTACAVNAGATLNILNAAFTSIGSLTVNAGGSYVGSSVSVSDPTNGVVVAGGTTAPMRGSLSMQNGLAGTMSVFGTAGVSLGGAVAGERSALNLELGASSDNLSISGPLNVNAGGVNITVTDIGVLGGHTYTLATFSEGTGAGFATGSGTTVGQITLTNPNIAFGINGSLVVTSTGIDLVTTGAPPPAVAYWSGSSGSAWNSVLSGVPNFTVSATGGPVASGPGATTDVFFSKTSPTNLTHTLGASFDINSLTYRGVSAAVTTTGANQLTLEGGGITLESGNGGATLGMSTLVLGASQVWTSNSVNPLTVSAAVSGAGMDLALEGSGPVALGGSSFTVSSLTVNSPLDLKGTSISSIFYDSAGDITNTGATNATLAATADGLVAFSGDISDDGSHSITLVKNGSGTLALTGENSYMGTTTINAGVLLAANEYALGTTAGGTTVANNATLDVNGFSVYDNLSVVGNGAGSAGALINSSATASIITGNVVFGGNTAVVTTGDITIEGTLSGGTITKSGAGSLVLTPPLDTGGNGAIVVNEGTLVPGVRGIASLCTDLTINNGATVRMDPGHISTATAIWQGQIGNTLVINTGGTLDLNDTEGVNNRCKHITGTGGLITNSGTGPALMIFANRDAIATWTWGGNIEDGVNGGTVSLTIANGGNGGFGQTNVLTGTCTYSGPTNITDNTIQAGSATALSPISAYSLSNSSNSRLDLNGFSNTIGSLSGNANSRVLLGPATLTTGGNDGITSYAGVISGDGSVIKTGLGTQSFTGLNTYTGNTTVSAGGLSNSQPYLADPSKVTVRDGAILDLNFVGTDTVKSLVIGTTQLLPGVYGSTLSGAANPDDVHFSGTGTLTVTHGPSEYDSWADSKGLTASNNGATVDPDHDGIKNMLEFVLGGNPLASDTSILPVQTLSPANFIFTFKRADESESEIALKFQFGPTLASWTNVAIGLGSAPADGNGVIVNVNEGSPITLPDVITVTVPHAVGGKLFGRLDAVK
ncbi:MAG: autotransporter-associated beta strand repeat-containing protein [Verrucomicrobiota bacterium]